MALALERQETCSLLTGDGTLRQIILGEGVDVRGTLWLVEEMFNAGLVDLARIRDAYIAMKADGSRLPWGEVDQQIERLSKS